MAIKPISRKSSDLGIDYSDFDDTPSGRHCKAFVRRTDGTALKVYDKRVFRDSYYAKQRELSNKGLAPACDDCIDIAMPDGSVKYAYTTIVADVPFDGFNGREVETAYARRRGITRSKACSDLMDLRERLDRAGYHWRDACIFNYGYVNGRAVLIDVELSN
jgi:hypothetical protein